MTRCCLVAVLALGLVAAADDKNTKDDLQGTWKLVKVDRNGKPREVTEKTPDFFHLKFAGNKIAVQFNGSAEEGAYQLGTDKGVKTINITPTTGDDAGETILGIYRVKGDELTLAVGEAGGKTRPTDFKGVEKKVTVYTLKRAASKD